MSHSTERSSVKAKGPDSATLGAQGLGEFLYISVSSASVYM